ncbi:MAG: hypothetical protein JSS66_06100 [Armatimonadetes bacterium]|nr:hypothetical protein [Armatimonadota bacterium]
MNERFQQCFYYHLARVLYGMPESDQDWQGYSSLSGPPPTHPALFHVFPELFDKWGNPLPGRVQVRM